MNFNGKVVLITGASSGIGAVTAEHLASLGASLSLTGRNEENLKIVAEACKKANSKSEHLYVVGDISKVDDIENILHQTIKTFKRLDILVNNAGYGGAATLETIKLEEYDAMQNTNVRGVLYLTKLASPHLIKSQGNIVNVSSLAGIRSRVGSLGYAMSKAALDQFTKCVALELAPKNVRVNSVNPGAVRTAFGGRMGLKEDFYDVIGKQHPIGRVGTSQEIANAIAFLASDLASNVTGAIFSVDGGMAIASALKMTED